MNLIFPTILLDIEIVPFCFNLIRIANQNDFSQIVSELIEIIENKQTGRIYLYDKTTPVSLCTKSKILFNPFSFNVQEDALTKEVRKKIVEHLSALGLEKTLEEWYLFISDFFDKNTVEMDYPLEIESYFSITEYIKFWGAKIKDDSVSVADRLVKYCAYCASLLNKNIFFFVNYNSYFSTEELDDINQQLWYNKVVPIFLEHIENGEERHDNESLITFDEDSCIMEI